MLLGESAQLNLGLSEEQKQALAGKSAEEVIAGFQQEKAKHAKGSSSFRGVHWQKSMCTWEVRISEGGKQKRLGYFGNELEAARAYDTAAVRIHGRWDGQPPATKIEAAAKAGRTAHLLLLRWRGSPESLTPT